MLRIVKRLRGREEHFSSHRVSTIAHNGTAADSLVGDGIITLLHVYIIFDIICLYPVFRYCCVCVFQHINIILRGLHYE